jgi:hypothetical protein
LYWCLKNAAAIAINSETDASVRNHRKDAADVILTCHDRDSTGQTLSDQIESHAIQ